MERYASLLSFDAQLNVHNSSMPELGCVYTFRRQNQRLETPIQNADPKRRSRGYCLCLPREEDDFVSMHCACVHYVDRRRHVKWDARFLGILNSGYCLFMHVSTARDLELK